jgi:hypothetical protein
MLYCASSGTGWKAITFVHCFTSEGETRIFCTCFLLGTTTCAAESIVTAANIPTITREEIFNLSSFVYGTRIY